jgi:hypothetical protein
MTPLKTRHLSCSCYIRAASSALFVARIALATMRLCPIQKSHKRLSSPEPPVSRQTWCPHTSRQEPCRLHAVSNRTMELSPVALPVKFSTERPDNEFSGPSRRRRAHHACSSCRTRKVRCDYAVRGAPCTNCELDHVECAVVPRVFRTKRYVFGGASIVPHHLVPTICEAVEGAMDWYAEI